MTYDRKKAMEIIANSELANNEDYEIWFTKNLIHIDVYHNGNYCVQVHIGIWGGMFSDLVPIDKKQSLNILVEQLKTTFKEE